MDNLPEQPQQRNTGGQLIELAVYLLLAISLSTLAYGAAMLIAEVMSK